MAKHYSILIRTDHGLKPSDHHLITPIHNGLDVGWLSSPPEAAKRAIAHSPRWGSSVSSPNGTTGIPSTCPRVSMKYMGLRIRCCYNYRWLMQGMVLFAATSGTTARPQLRWEILGAQAVVSRIWGRVWLPRSSAITSNSLFRPWTMARRTTTVAGPGARSCTQRRWRHGCATIAERGAMGVDGRD
jgi:hypothetical protein